MHRALIYQIEVEKGYHTSKVGLIFRANPGRLILYPFEAATCAVIFFGGDLWDAAIAAVAGLAAGIVEWVLGMDFFKNTGKPLIDILAGTSTGAIGGLFYRYSSTEPC